MALIEPELGMKLIYILGITNILGILLVFFSCRCMAGIKLVNKMLQYEWYKKYYNKHCYYWWIFVISVLLHTIMAFLIFGNPF